MADDSVVGQAIQKAQTFGQTESDQDYFSLSQSQGKGLVLKNMFMHHNVKGNLICIQARLNDGTSGKIPELLVSAQHMASSSHHAPVQVFNIQQGLLKLENTSSTPATTSPAAPSLAAGDGRSAKSFIRVQSPKQMAQVLGRLQPQQVTAASLNRNDTVVAVSSEQLANRVRMQPAPKTVDDRKPSTSRQYSLLKPNLLKSSQSAARKASTSRAAIDYVDSDDDDVLSPSAARAPTSTSKPKSAKKATKKRRISDASTTSTASNVSSVAAALATLPAPVPPKKKRGRGN